MEIKQLQQEAIKGTELYLKYLEESTWKKRKQGVKFT